MSTEPKSLAIVPTDLGGFADLASRFAKSSLLPEALRAKPDDVFVTLLAGHELGLTPMAALRGIHVIKGKPILTADTMVAIVLSSGAAEYFVKVEESDESATYETKRKGAPIPQRATWTLTDAKRAKLLSNDNWVNNPRAMCRARAKSILARDVYPDVLAGCYEEGEADEIVARDQSGTPTKLPIGPMIDAGSTEQPAAPSVASNGKPAAQAKAPSDTWPAFLADIAPLVAAIDGLAEHVIGNADVGTWAETEVETAIAHVLDEAKDVQSCNAAIGPWVSALNKHAASPRVLALKNWTQAAYKIRNAKLREAAKAGAS